MVNTIQKNDGSFLQASVVVTIALSVTIRPHRMSPTLKSTVTLEQNLERKGLINVSQILTQSERHVWLSYVKEIVSISFAV